MKPCARRMLVTKANRCWPCAGVGSYLLSRQAQADRILSAVTRDGVAMYVHGQCLLSLNRPDEAAARFEAAAKSGVDPVGCTLRRAGAVRASGRVDEAEKMLRSVAAAAASRAEYSFQMGCIWADRGDSLTAVEYFERAVDMDPHHSRALFWLAAENALRGNDDDAIRFYERSLSRPLLHRRPAQSRLALRRSRKLQGRRVLFPTGSRV
ncbi:MAG UNVERIFIED_CONTAM: tetratricopeptide repeat protein [Planctomycetaceae bacterium]